MFILSFLGTVKAKFDEMLSTIVRNFGVFLSPSLRQWGEARPVEQLSLVLVVRSVGSAVSVLVRDFRGHLVYAN